MGLTFWKVDLTWKRWVGTGRAEAAQRSHVMSRWQIGTRASHWGKLNTAKWDAEVWLTGDRWQLHRWGVSPCSIHPLFLPTLSQLTEGGLHSQREGLESSLPQIYCLVNTLAFPENGPSVSPLTLKTNKIRQGTSGSRL
jgi:hypothetical protein